MFFVLNISFLRINSLNSMRFQFPFICTNVAKYVSKKKKLYLLLFIALKSWRQQNIHSRKVGNGTNMMGMGVIPYWGRQTMAPNKKQEDTYRHTPLLLFLHLTSGLRLLRHPTPPFNKRNNHNHPPGSNYKIQPLRSLVSATSKLLSHPGWSYCPLTLCCYFFCSAGPVYPLCHAFSRVRSA